MLGIVIITYNAPRLIKPQLDCIKKFCQNKYRIIVVDNSTDQEAADAIRYHTLNHDTEADHLYIRTQASSKNGSSSHAFAANIGFLQTENYEYVLYLDHDCFPIKPFMAERILGNAGMIMAGVGQEKSRTYFWPGCLLWDNFQINRSRVDFSPSHSLQLDTGGNLHVVMDAIGRDRCLFFDEKHMENPNFTKSFYNFYTLINDGMFMHFVNGSGWNKNDDHDERINSLLNVLQEYTGVL